MAKKAAPPKKPAADSNKQLVDAIVTVKRLQDFVKNHDGLEKAMNEVACVQSLVKLTGGFEQLKQALEIIGREEAPAQA
jgi:hypothetical protein